MRFGRQAFAVLALLTAIAADSGSAVAVDNEGFTEFFNRFTTDVQFRSARLLLPLPVTVGSPSEGQVNEKWSIEQIGQRMNLPLSAAQLAREGLQEQVLRTKRKEMQVVQTQPESDSYIMKYRFKLRRGLWYLIHYEDSSY